MFWTFLIFFNAIIILFAFYNIYWKRRKLPPGPTPLPLFGNLLAIIAEPAGEPCFNRWAKKYGPVFTFWLSELPVIIMTDYEQIIETFVKDGDTYAGRLVFPTMDKLLKGGTYGVIQTEGELWRDQRRFALHVFRDFGVGKNLMQEKILAEISTRFEKLNSELQKCNEVSLDSILDVSIGSIINDLLFGYRFEDENLSDFKWLKTLVSEMMRKLWCFENHMMNSFPILRKFPHFSGVFNETRAFFTHLHAFYSNQIEKHRAEINFDDLDAPSADYVEAFLKERERRERSGEVNHFYTNDQLVHMCFDLWVAGQETTSTTLAWGFAYIIHNLDIQRKLHKELDTVIGSVDRFITIADKPNLPYTNAVVNEIQRIANLVPINVLHRTTRAVTINGHFLPEGTCIIPQISALLYNDDYFPDPMKFNPERYLSVDGKLTKCDELIPFSAGKR